MTSSDHWRLFVELIEITRHRRGYLTAITCLAAILASTGVAEGSDWQMRGRDMGHAGRADFVVPAEKLGSTFFDTILWQVPSPGSPGTGNFSSGSMVYFDGVGPDGSDLVVGSYHWPKGVMGMDRQTGETFWYGNPSGGESIAYNTPAFSNDGSTVYVINDATSSGSFPNGHPLMAFDAQFGPSSFWHNGNDPEPGHLSINSPTVAIDDRVFLHSWVDRPYGATDYGTYLSETWAAENGADMGHCDPSIFFDWDMLAIVVGGRDGWVRGFEGDEGYEMWSMHVGHSIDATATIDPDTGNIYIPAGDDDIYVVGLDLYGDPLWMNDAMMVFDYEYGVNNKQRAQSAGCLSHDGETFYFQTNSSEGDGALYAINTYDGSVKWSYPTNSTGWEMISSSPIVTENDVVVVGNNNGGVYYAIHDTGTEGTLLDTFTVAGGGNARSSAVISDDGKLYLPLRTPWIVGNGDGDVPSASDENVFTCFDVENAGTVLLPHPAGQTAVARNNSVKLSWQPIPDAAGVFVEYAIYRSTSEFSSVESMTPIGTVADINIVSYDDDTAVNGTSYYYAITTVCIGGEGSSVGSVGPRTPWDETDLQIVTISRTPRFPRYDPTYTVYEITEPSGFGPYRASVATGLGSGQDESTIRWPDNGSLVTYTATVRNRGTNTWSGTLSGTWRVDGYVDSSPSQSVVLEPGDTETFALAQVWDGVDHDISFTLDLSDSRSSNNELSVSSKSVAFLSYVDISRIEDFREATVDYPSSATDDFIDWMNLHMARFNELFEDAGCGKRVHYDTLEVLGDLDPDPAVDRINYAIFPFRYLVSDGTLRLSGYYDESEDLDYGLLHEWGHQLGLIDIYQLDVPAELNHVSGLAYYSAPQCLMHGVSHFLSQHSADAMNYWLDVAHGYFGQYMYKMPEEVRIQFLDRAGAPLDNATVTVYQMADMVGAGKVVSTEIKAQGTTGGDGVYVLPNVSIDPGKAPMTFAGDQLHDNPFGYLDVVGRNGLLHFKVESDGEVDYAWLDITEVNDAYWQGNTEVATFPRQMLLGGPKQFFPPADLTELNAADWSAVAEAAEITLSDDLTLKQVGEASLHIDTTGAFDTYWTYPLNYRAQWDLTDVEYIHAWFYAHNDNQYGFQGQSPHIRLGDANGYYQWKPDGEILNGAEGQWIEVFVPIEGNAIWERTQVGTPSLSEVEYIEIHADTWGDGFELWVDGLSFDPHPRAGDYDRDGDIDLDDFASWDDCVTGPDAAYLDSACRAFDFDADDDVDLADFGALQLVFEGV